MKTAALQGRLTLASASRTLEWGWAVAIPPSCASPLPPTALTEVGSDSGQAGFVPGALLVVDHFLRGLRFEVNKEEEQE